MSHFWELIKINIKLLLRNKGFLFFLVITPIVSVAIMTVRTDSSSFYKETEEERTIQELSGPEEKVVYLNDWSVSAYSVKVYDGAGSKLSEYILQEMADTSMFSIYRQDAGKMTEEEVLEQAKKDAFHDRMGTILYLKPEFDQAVMSGNWEEAVLFYQVSEDERWELWEDAFANKLAAIHQVAQGVGTKETQVLAVLKSIEDNMPAKKIVSLDGKNEISLNTEQNAKKNLAGYAYSIITLGFLFCGVCIAYTVIEERENKVYTRIMLSKVGRYEYLLSKLVLSVLVSILQTGVTAVCMLIVKDMDFGVAKPSFLLFILLLGLIFNVLSMGVGVMIGDVMGANYAVFAIWSVSALLAGLFFPIDGSSAMIKYISYLMPQRWFLKGTEMLMVGDRTAYPMIFCITLAYLIIILCVGAVGLRMKESEA